MDKRVHTFPKGITLKANLIARVELELANSDVAVQHFSHYITGLPFGIMSIHFV